MRLKYKLRYAEKPPAFLVPHDIEWHAWMALTSDECTLRYLQPKFTDVDETDDEGNLLPVHEVNAFGMQPLAVAKDWIATLTDFAEKDDNLSAGRYKPFALDTTEHKAPAILIRELKELEAKIQGGLDILLEMVEGRE